MRRIYHPYWTWEEHTNGMWQLAPAEARPELLRKAVEFTGDAKLYGAAMMRVIEEWPISCEQNLTDVTMNRLAWVGHAACSLQHGIPEDITRKAWAMLTDKQRTDADAEAQKAVDEWCSRHTRARGGVSEELATQGIP